MEEMAAWVHQGKLQVKETFHHGIEEWPNAFRQLFEGGNIGKVVVTINHDVDHRCVHSLFTHYWLTFRHSHDGSNFTKAK